MIVYFVRTGMFVAQSLNQTIFPQFPRVKPRGISVCLMSPRCGTKWANARSVAAPVPYAFGGYSRLVDGSGLRTKPDGESLPQLFPHLNKSLHLALIRKGQPQTRLPGCFSTQSGNNIEKVTFACYTVSRCV
jgi:hypothetical protein